MPEDVAGAGTGKIADAGDLKIAWVHAQIDAARPLAVIDQPFVNIAGRRILPEDVAGTVAGEIANADDLVAGRMVAEAHTRHAHWPLEPSSQMSVATVPSLLTPVHSTSSMPLPKKSPMPAIW